MTESFEMRLDQDRQDLLEEVEERILPRIDKTSRTGAVLMALQLGLEYLDKLEEKEEEIQQLKQDWSVKSGTSKIELEG